MSSLLAIFLTTFLAEDASLVLAAYLIAKGTVSPFEAYVVCAAGISLGDYLLFLFGRFLAWASQRQGWEYMNRLKARFEKRISQESLSALVCISRFVPGTRLPTYIGAGILSFSGVLFFVLTAASVLVWVGFALFASAGIYQLVGGSWVWSTLLIVFGLWILKKGASIILDPWARRGFPYSFEKWRYFEFWPAYLFYPPVVVWYAILSIRYRCPFAPLYSNPKIENGGMVGESKWELYHPLMTKQSEHWLKTTLIRRVPEMVSAVRQAMETEGIVFPFVLKPDKGQRGYGVRVIRDPSQLADYFRAFDFDVLLQELCPWENEAGIFFYRLPGETKGRLFSLTDKKLPFVLGDGKSRLGELILKDRRARLIAKTYFSQLRPLLDSIPTVGQKVTLTDTGNHCRGAIFTNGESLYSEPLRAKLDLLFNQISDFHFGRFDVRYENADSLKRAENFKIVELNGASSEATHIWDRNTPLLEAYRVLFEQWNIAFDIGSRVKARQSENRVQVVTLFGEWVRMLFA